MPGVVFAFILGDLDLFLFSLYDCSYLVTEKGSCNSISSIIIISAVFYHALVVFCVSLLEFFGCPGCVVHFRCPVSWLVVDLTGTSDATRNLFVPPSTKVRFRSNSSHSSAMIGLHSVLMRLSKQIPGHKYMPITQKSL